MQLGNKFAYSISHRDVKNAAADVVSYSVNDALWGAASIVSDATVAERIDNELIIATSVEIWKLLAYTLEDLWNRLMLGIVAVSIISVGVLTLISVTND